MKRFKIFLDTNILISGIFFSGLESILLKVPNVSFITSDVNYQEVLEVVKRKFKKLHIKILKVALDEIDKAFQDIKIISEKEWKDKLDEASKFVSSNDRKILAAVLFSNPDYFVTGDKDFHKAEVRKLVKVVRTRKMLEEIEIYSSV